MWNSNQRLLLVENTNKNQENEIEILRNNFSSIRATLQVNEEAVTEPPIEIGTSSVLIRRGRPAQLIPLQSNNGYIKLFAHENQILIGFTYTVL